MANFDVKSKKSFNEAYSLINRNTTRKEIENNPLAILIFDQFNTTVDKNGKRDDKFDKKEWRAYQTYLKQVKEREESISRMKQTEEITTLQKKITEQEKKLNSLNEKWLNVHSQPYFENFQKLETELEKKYGVTLLSGIQDEEQAKQAVKEGAIEVDISSFKRGNLDNENKEFSGIQQKAYIKFPQEMGIAEREEFLQVLNKALEQSKTQDQIQTEFSNEYSIKRKAEHDLDNIYLSSGKKNNSSKPDTNFIEREIEKLEHEWANINKKYDKTEAEQQRLIAIEKILNSYYDLLDGYSDIYTPQEGWQEAPGLSATYTEEGNYRSRDDNENDNKVLKDSHQIDLRYNILDWKTGLAKFGLRFKKTEQYITEYGEKEEGQESPQKFSNEYLINPSFSYDRNKFSVGTNLSWNILPESLVQRHSVDLKYGNTSTKFETNPRTYTVKMPDENGDIKESKETSEDTKVTVEQKINKFSTSGFIGWNSSQNGRLYGADSSVNLSGTSKNQKWSGSLTPSTGATYIDNWTPNGHDSWELRAGIMGNVSFQGGKTNASLMVMDNYNGTFASGYKPENSNFLMSNLSVEHGKFGLETGYTNQYSHSSSFSRISNEGTFAVSYRSPVGKIKAEYTIGKTKSSIEMCPEQIDTKRKWTNSFVLSLTTTLDDLRNVLKHKSKNK